MTAHRGRSTGATLGATLGVVVVVLMWQLGVCAPDRLALFGVVAASMVAVIALLKRPHIAMRDQAGRGLLAAGLLGALALTGIPEYVTGGHVDDGCHVAMYSSIDSKAVEDTSTRDPFDLDRDDAMRWYAYSEDELAPTEGSLGLKLGGFSIPLWNPLEDSVRRSHQWRGVTDTERHLDTLEATTGITVTGVYHLYGSIESSQGDCAAHGYIRIQPDHLFDGPILIGIWVTLVALLTAIVIRKRRLT